MGTEKLEKVAKDANLVTEHKKTVKGDRASPIGDLTPIKRMSKVDLQREVGANRKKIREFDAKILEFTKAKGPQEDAIPPEMWAVFPAMVYDYMASRFGSHWKLQEDEILLYGQNLQKVADRYLGTVAGDNPELFSLAIVAVSTTVPRVMITIKQRREDAPQRKETHGNSDRPGSKGIGKEQLDTKSSP